jgi:hypothetical protein
MMMNSEKSVDEGESDQGEVGELGSRFDAGELCDAEMWVRVDSLRVGQQETPSACTATVYMARID